MNEDERARAAFEQLDRLMTFFSRVDSKATFLFALDTGLLALIGLNVHPDDLALWYVGVPGVLAVGLVALSLFFVMRELVPHLDGGRNSIIYFGEIAMRTEATFIEEFERLSQASLTRDALGQVWRNAQILKIKFGAVNWAFKITTAALVPWIIFLGATAFLHGQIPALR
jgi:hypothetical protein